MGRCAWHLMPGKASCAKSCQLCPPAEDEDLVLASFRQQQQQYQALMKGLQVRQVGGGAAEPVIPQAAGGSQFMEAAPQWCSRPVPVS